MLYVYVHVHIYTQDQLDPIFLFLDANFRLCRRKKAGMATLQEKPLFKDEIFLNQAVIDQYVSTSALPATIVCDHPATNEVIKSQYSKWCIVVIIIHVYTITESLQ